jgi:hypothetical protein
MSSIINYVKFPIVHDVLAFNTYQLSAQLSTFLVFSLYFYFMTINDFH